AYLHSDPVVSITWFWGTAANDSSTVTAPDPATYTYLSPGSYLITQRLLGSTGCVTSDTLRIEVLKGFASGQSLELAYTTLQDGSLFTTWRETENCRIYLLERTDEKNNAW